MSASAAPGPRARARVPFEASRPHASIDEAGGPHASAARGPPRQAFEAGGPHAPAGVLGTRRRLWAGESIEGLACPAFGGFGAAGAQPGRGQVRARLGETLFEVADFRLEPILRCH